jgi:phosphatidylserine synthase
MIVILAFLMVSQVEYEVIPEGFQTKAQRLKLLILIAAGIAVAIQPRLLLFPIIALYILQGVIRELYRLFHKGVDRVAAPYRRRKTDREEINE